MRIFGYNYIILKSYKLKDLVYTDNEVLKETDLVVREAYFHLFCIPFFSLGRRYHLKGEEGYYKVPDDLMQMIDKHQVKVRKKWYAWILTLVMGLGLALFGMGWEFYESGHFHEANQTKNRINHFLEFPKEGDRFSLLMNGDFLYGEVQQVDQYDIWLTIDYGNYTLYKLRQTIHSKPIDVIISINDSLDKVEYLQKEFAQRSEFLDSLRGEYPDQALLRELIALDLEKVPRTYETIKMSRKEFEMLKSTTAGGEEKVVLPSLKHITGSGVQIGTDVLIR